MKIVLFSMPDVAPYLFSRRWRCPNLAIASLAGNLDERHTVYLADLITQRHRVRDAIVETIDKYRPDIVGLSSMTFQFRTARAVAKVVKSMSKDIKVVLGGYHSTLLAEEIAKSPDAQYFDFFVRGEGEKVFNELAGAIENGKGFENVPSILYRKDGVFVENPRKPVEDLSEIALPDRSRRIWTKFNYYFRNLEVLESSRGCTMPCSFCSMRQMYGRTFRKYSLERVMRDIANLKECGGTLAVFSDDNITLDVDWLEKLCDAIVEAGHNDIRYILQASCAGIAKKPELAKKMAKAGFYIVFLGIENVSERNLKAMHKGGMNPLDKITRSIQYLHDNDILIVGGMIVGNPDDTIADIRENFEFFRKMEIDYNGDQIVTPYPKTEMRQELIKRGLVVNPSDYGRYNGFWANVRTKNLSPEELQFIKWKFDNRYSRSEHPSPLVRKKELGAYLIRRVFQMPIRRVKRYFRYRGKSEQERFQMEMDAYWAWNVFPGLEQDEDK